MFFFLVFFWFFDFVIGIWFENLFFLKKKNFGLFVGFKKKKPEKNIAFSIQFGLTFVETSSKIIK